MNIYERYFSMKCDTRLIHDDKLRIVLENNICREDGPQPNCFCIPMSYAWTALNDIFMPKFLKSSVYTSYIEKLQRSITATERNLTTNAMPAATETRSGSNLSSNMSSNRSSLSLDSNDVPQPRQPEFKGSKIDLLDENNLEDFWFKDTGGEPSSGK